MLVQSPKFDDFIFPIVLIVLIVSISLNPPCYKHTADDINPSIPSMFHPKSRPFFCCEAVSYETSAGEADVSTGDDFEKAAGQGPGRGFKPLNHRSLIKMGQSSQLVAFRKQAVGFEIFLDVDSKYFEFTY